ncbi:alpha/beta hydrolase [Chelativorans sp. Marseille-P2723]|uniref:alpha/beta fold hydrolase n=1 Tax=Chelativorans sp. Marseille-P2723 TaxID=2709133 RepID=UPI00156D4EB2|nr:alpha/beta hydrolase [Chelativorans sp. Marseille-P2723]
MPNLLREIPENPIPEGAVSGMMSAFDGRQIRYACFPSAGSAGTVVILPGRNECIEKYFETVEDLASRGFSAVSFDWRGQGGSERLLKDPRRGHIESFDDYVADLDQFFREIVLPDCRPPYSILAHSTGALIALLASSDLANRVRRMVLLAPLLDVAAPVQSRLLARFSAFLNAFGLGRIYIAGASRRGQEIPFQPSALTSDQRRHDRNQALLKAFPELFIGGPTASWVNAAFDAVQRVRHPDFAAGIRIPVLMLTAGADRVVSTTAAEEYGRSLRLGKVLSIDGARHELLQEADIYREQVLAAFAVFAGSASSTTVSGITDLV